MGRNISSSIRMTKTVSSNLTEYSKFPEPSKEWKKQDVELSQSVFRKAYANGWIEKVRVERRTVWKTTRTLYDCIQREIEKREN